MQAHIRPFTSTDYPGIAAVFNAANPQQFVTAEELRKGDEHHAQHHFQRWIAEVEGRIAANGLYTQNAQTYHPHKFWFYVSVHPDYQNQGIGSAMYEQIMQALSPLEPISLRVEVREDMTRSIQFLQKRGFREDRRSWESHLDVAAFDPTPYAGLEEALHKQGIEIKARKELAVDPDRNRRLHALDDELNRDVPLPPDEQWTTIDFDYFVEHWMNNPQSPEDAYVIAVADGEYVGEAGLWKKPEVDYIITDLTGVKRAYRRKRIALALKLRGIAYAKAHGYKTLKTWNDTYNAAMLALNTRLGFVRQLAVIEFVKDEFP